MDKRLEKRHKRQVARAKLHAKVSLPDVRTPEEIRAAREASRPKTGLMHFSNAGGAGNAPVGAGHSVARVHAAKTDT
ncbi:MAG: hypothetical protein KJZ70_12055 [Bryobacterales bacterium]|nr:hypothetical protein [Bryobacterales bacterium]